MSITVELAVVGSSSRSRSHFFTSSASTSSCSSGFPEAGWDFGEPAGEPSSGEAAEAGDAGDAGDAGETGEGGDVGEVGDGGERGGDGGGTLTCTSLFTLSESAGAAGGSWLFSDMLPRSSSWVRNCF